MHKVKVNSNLASVLTDLNVLQQHMMLAVHQRSPLGWVGEYACLNGISHELLKQAVTMGYEVDEQATNLQRDDHEAMLDIALATNDQTWFEELCETINKGK